MGRKKLPEKEKVVLLRIYVKKGVVNWNGGYAAAQNFAKRCLIKRAEDKQRE